MKASIIILTKNGEKSIKRCLDKIAGQKFGHDFEIIAIDSGSTDKTMDLLKSHPLNIRVYEIPAGDFSHSRTRNLGALLATGEYVVYLTQDSEPVDGNWLEYLISPFNKNASVGAVFGRQIPTPNINPVNTFHMQWIYGEYDLIKHKDSKFEFSRMYFNFSNVNSAVKKDLLLRFPFSEDLLFCEDVYLAKQLLSNGYKIAYSAKAAVFHSHNHAIVEIFRRYFDIAVAYRKIGILDDTKKIEDEGRKYIIEKMKYLIKNKCWLWVPYAAVNNLAKYAGFKMGCMEHLIPLVFKQKISRYWYKDIKAI